MRSLHFHLPFGMYHRARAPSIRFRLPPTLWTDYLLVPPISMLQQQLPQHLSHQLPSLKRQLACYLIKARLRMLLPPLPHLLKHRLRTSHKFRLRLFSFHLAPPFALLSSYSKSTSFQPRKKSGMHPPVNAKCKIPHLDVYLAKEEALLYALSPPANALSWKRAYQLRPLPDILLFRQACN